MTLPCYIYIFVYIVFREKGDRTCPWISASPQALPLTLQAASQSFLVILQPGKAGRHATASLSSPRLACPVLAMPEPPSLTKPEPPSPTKPGPPGPRGQNLLAPRGQSLRNVRVAQSSTLTVRPMNKSPPPLPPILAMANAYHVLDGFGEIRTC